MSLIKARKPSISNLGEMLSRFAQLEADNIIMHEDVSAWGAPSECHIDVDSGFQNAWAVLEEEIGAFGFLMNEARKRIGGNTAHRYYELTVSRIASRDWRWVR